MYLRMRGFVVGHSRNIVLNKKLGDVVEDLGSLYSYFLFLLLCWRLTLRTDP